MDVISRTTSLLLASAALSACSGSDARPPDPAGHAKPQVCAVGSVPAAAGYAGVDEASARDRARAEGLTVRVLGYDGNCAIPSGSREGKRLNLYFEEGKVAVASIG